MEIKIYQDNNDWIGLVLKPNKRKYRVSFNKNFIFYCESRESSFNECLNLFIKDVENGNYDLY